MMELPPNFRIAQANSNGDGFFDSVAQGLEQLKPELKCFVKSLRKVCKSFAQSQLKDEQSWLRRALTKKNESIDEFIRRIEFTENDVDQKSGAVNVLGLTSLRGGSDPSIEGRIICAEYNVKLHVVERHIVENRKIWTHQIIDSGGSRFVDAVDYNNDENTIHVVKKGNLHFEPILRITTAVQPNKQRSPDPSEDSDEEGVEMTPGEELFQSIRSKDSEADKVTRVTKLFERAPALDVNFQGINNNTSLHIAVRKRELQVIEILVNKKARTDIKNNNNKSPLDVAKSLKREDIVQILEPSVQKILDEEEMKNDEENNAKINIKLNRQKGVSHLTDGELPRDKDNKFQKYDQTTKGKCNKLTYKKRSGTAGMDGHLYEIKLSMLLLLQAETKENFKITSFCLATNMQEAGDFDDVVFKYKYLENELEKSNIIFLQAKHKGTEKGNKFTIDTLLSTSEKGDFLLSKYLSSYRQIKQLKLKMDHPLFRGGVDKCDFVIYTNATCDFHKSSDCLQKKKVEPEDILYVPHNPKNYYYKLNADETVKDVLRHSLDFKKLVRELAQSVYSGNIDLNKLIFKIYQASLTEKVIQISETNKEESRLRRDFLDGSQDAEFTRTFLLEIQNNPNYRNMFSAESDDELKKELRNKIIKLTGNFGCDEDNDFKLSLPKKTIPDESIEEFLNELKLFINQPNVCDLEDTIKNIIIETFKIAEKNDANLIYCDVHDELTKWWRQRGNVEYITEHNRIFNKSKENLSNMNLVGLAISQVKRIKSLGLSFQSEHIQRLSKLIREKRILNIISSRDALVLSTVKVHQALEGMAEYKSEDDNDKYIFLSLISALELQNKVIDAFKSERRDLLVIECEGRETRYKEFYNQLHVTMQNSDCKKIVLITGENDPFAEQFKNDFAADSQNMEEMMYDHNTLADLDIESQAIVEEKQVIFQGIEVGLGTLVDEKSKHLISGDVLSKLINNKKIKVDKAIDASHEMKYHYINRILHRRENIKIECFKDTHIRDIFVVSNIKETHFSLLAGGGKVYKITDINPDLQNSIRFIASDDDENVEENLKQLQTKYPTSNIHWLKKEGDKFIWQQSHNSLSKLLQFVDPEDVKAYPADKISNVPNRVVVVSAEPGMGKSMLLTKIAEEEKRVDSSLWVVRINLNDCTKQLNEMRFNENDLSGTINFLLEITGLESPLEKELFKYRVENGGKIAFLFDGFDEISPQYKEKVIALVKILKETKVAKLWITTRLYMRRELEDELSVLSFTLKPLTAEDQIYFLKKYWARELDINVNTEDHRLNIYIRKLLEVLSRSIADKERDFTGIPLQTRMLAEVYQDKFKEFYRSEQSIPEFSGKLNMLDLYESFIKKKHRLYWSEKNKADLTNDGIDRTSKRDNLEFILKHQLLALHVLFSDEELDLLLSREKKQYVITLKEDVSQGLEKTGIIDHIFKGTINFIHRTFAEYFAASWLADKQHRPEVKKFLLSKIFETENEVLRNFFDRILAKDENNEIHTAILNYDIVRAKQLSSSSQNREVDKGGRTALHLAAAYGYLDIVQILLNTDADGIDTVDEIFSWRPLSYADKVSHWHVAEFLLQRGACGNDMYEAISNINALNIHGETLLHTASEKGFLKFAEFLIQRKANIDARTHSNMTPLHFAAKKGNLGVVKLLIEKGADLNSEDDESTTALHSATERGDLDAVKLLLENGANVNCQNRRGTTALHSATERGNFDVVKILLENGANVNCQNRIGTTALHFAAEKGNFNIIKLLLEKEADLICKNIDGDTVLHIAVKTCKLDVVKLLLEKGANVSCQNRIGTTALHFAAESGNLDVVKFLIEKGTDLNCQNIDGDTALHFAVEKCKLDVVKLLVEKGARLNHKNKTGGSALHYAARKGYLDVVKFLIEKGAKLNQQNKTRSSALHCAAQGYCWDVVKFLVREGAFINCQTNNGYTVLHFAAERDNIDVVKLLLEKGANVRYQNKMGATALHFAAERGNFDMIKLLLEKGADLICQNNDGDTVLHVAVQTYKFDVVKLLLEKGAKVNHQNKTGRSALHYAAAHRNLDVVKLLIEKGAFINCKDNSSNTALHYAIEYGNLDTVNLLMGEGADLNHNFNDTTVLHYAAAGGKLDLVKLFLEKGADINCQDNSGDTVVHWAARRGHLDVVKFFIDRGANFNLKNNNGNTSLHLAAEKDQFHIVKFLLEEGADVNNQNNDGNTVLHFAAERGNLDVVKFLILRGADFKIKNNNGDTALLLAAERSKTDIEKFLLDNGAGCNLESRVVYDLFRLAVGFCQIDITKLLLKNISNCNCEDDGKTVLHFAAENGDFVVVRFLVKEETDLNRQDNNGSTALHYAAGRGDLNVIKLLIENGANLNSKDKTGNSVLHLAAWGGNLDVVKLFIEKGADINCKNNNGDTVLFFAAKIVQFDIVKYLTEKSAIFDIKNIND